MILLQTGLSLGRQMEITNIASAIFHCRAFDVASRNRLLSIERGLCDKPIFFGKDSHYDYYSAVRALMQVLKRVMQVLLRNLYGIPIAVRA